MSIRKYSGTGKKKNHSYQCSDCYRTWVNKSSATSHKCKGNPFDSMSGSSSSKPRKQSKRRRSTSSPKTSLPDSWYPFEQNGHLRALAQNDALPRKNPKNLRRRKK